MDSHQASLQPNLLLLGSHLRFNPTPTFLGITFDRTLSFSKHVSLLKSKFFPRLKALRCISASSWGPSKESLSLFYKALTGWFPLLSITNIIKLERLHRAASRTITSCLSSSPIPLLLSKASLPPLRVTLTHFTLSSYERALRLPISFPISGLVRLGVNQDSEDCFRELLHPLTRSCSRSTSPREALLAFPHFPPWNPLCFTVKSTLFSLVLIRHTCCVLSRLRCNGHSLLLSFYLFRIGRIENPSCSAYGHSSQDTSHLILHCPATDSLCRLLFGDSLSLYDLWSRLWGIAWLLGLHGLPPCPHPSEGVG